tara:strand:+ start:77 stop:349 length:273 start_codon:yes stop_codon:yes gene_type:complete
MIKLFRVIAFLEGVSYLLLLFIATPIKYIFENDFYVKLLGMPHGILFLMYICAALILNYEFKWHVKTLTLILLASIIPFGTFYIDYKYFK